MEDTVTASMSVHGDKDGFISLECPSCNGHFKMLIEDYKSDSFLDIYCTYCGLPESTSEFISSDVLEAAERKLTNHAHAMLEDMLNKTFGGIKSSKDFEFTHHKVDLGRVSETEVFENDTLEMVNFSCCGKRLKVTSGNEQSLLYCSFCGVNK